MKKTTTQVNILRIASEVNNEIKKRNRAYYLVACDFQKAYDSIHHDYLIQKLEQE